MAISLDLSFPKDIQVVEPIAETPKPSLFARVMAVGKSLKSMKPADVAWMGGNMVVGAAAAKLGAAGVALAASTLGATALAGTASIIAVGAVSAITGGVLSGTARALLQHIRDQRKFERAEPRGFLTALKEEASALYYSQQFRDKVKKSTKSALLGAGFLGAFHGVSTFLETTEVGQAISSRLKDTFQNVAQNVAGRGFASFNDFRKNLHTKIPLSSAVAETLPRPVIPAVADIPVVDDVPAPTQQLVAAAIIPPPAQPPIEEIVKHAQSASVEAAKSAVQADVSADVSAAVTERVMAKAALAVQQTELTNHYTVERLRNLIKDTTGVEASESATAEDLAKQFHAENSEAFLKGIQQQAPQLKVENLAAACETQIPKQKGAVNVIQTICHKFKSHMSGEDIVTLNDTNQPDAQKGLRVFYRRAVQAIGGVVKKENTTDFLLENITGPNGGVQEMTEQAFETAENTKLAEAAPSF